METTPSTPIKTPAPRRAFNFKLFVKLDRIAAWTLLLVMLSYALTGYGMTKGLIDRNIARSWHFAWLGGIGLVALIIHTGWAIHLAFRRWRLWNRFSRFGLITFYVLLAAFFLYVQFFYSSTGNFDSVSSGAITAGVNSKLDLKSLPVFTAETLAVDNGLAGRPAYVAIDGLVYDLSALFRNGQHAGHSAGQDLSAAFHGAHPDSYLQGYQIVGTYQ